MYVGGHGASRARQREYSPQSTVHAPNPYFRTIPSHATRGIADVPSFPLACLVPGKSFFQPP
jgi:hypothetical protein